MIPHTSQEPVKSFASIRATLVGMINLPETWVLTAPSSPKPAERPT